MENISPIFKKEFSLSGKVKKAICEATAFGVYNLYLNGEKVGDIVMAPGWTSFKSRIQYQTYDLTDLLSEKNVVSMKCAKGWALGNLGFLTAGGKVRPNPTTENIAIIFALEIEYEDGRCERIISDESWEVYTSEIISSELYNGETVDMTAPIEKVCDAVIVESEKPRLIPQVGEYVKE